MQIKNITQVNNLNPEEANPTISTNINKFTDGQKVKYARNNNTNKKEIYKKQQNYGICYNRRFIWNS